MEQCGGTVEQCGRTEWNSVAQCGGTVWNNMVEGWNSVKRYGRTVEECGGREE